MNNCAYCIQETGTLVPAVTTVAGTLCCRVHAAIELQRMQAGQQSEVKKVPKAGDKLAKSV